ncbi:AAA family ATPase [Acidianus manzaensis]|uniref:ATPase domain-containing protein n=1 Tax=Acidianus manzaensis TaxID=282676 RepID=A0A1W6JWV6_9CREN|nr:ATP-binding protein [Acidianus manzaensis]ARM74748.1 hypothetical protein B6F84_01050 [Acidianus manzaensis]
MGGKVIFSKKPRYSLEEIFDREEEINQLSFLLKRGEWVIILGPRMSGKTSIALAVSNYVGKKVIYVDLTKVKGLKDFTDRLYFSIPKSISDKVKETLETIGVKIGPASLSFKLKNSIVLESILKSVCDSTLILDEAQYLNQGINNLIPIFHNLLNSCSSLSIIFTGSAIGLIKTILEQKGEEPLAGRRPTEIVLKTWKESVAKEYIKRGLQNCNVNFKDEEIDEVISEVGTLVGWLNIYGVNRCVKNHEDALKETIEEGINIAVKELDTVVERQRWRVKALKMLCEGATWTELKEKTKVSTQTLSNFLDRLNRVYLLSKIERTYYISDPIYRKAIMRK